MRIGFVSTQFPADLKTSVYGGFKRMGMFIQALSELGELDMLFYVRPELELGGEFLGESREQLSRHFGARLDLSLCNLAPVKPVRSR
jgi:hypothetical protein